MTPGTRFDVLVAGGGSAGCVLAARLSEDGRRVGLVEAGPDYGPYDDGRWPADMLDARSLAFSHAWETDREDRSQLRARILGGCSAHNACILLAGAPADYDEWGHGWSHETIEPYLRRAERAVRMRQVEREELSPWHAAFADAAGDDAILHPVNAVGTVRWNAAFAYLDPARSRTNLTILADTLVDRVLFEGDRAVGLATSAGELRADTVVLAAGAYGSPGILLRSGAGAELPVGEGLIDHVGVGFRFEGTERLAGRSGRLRARAAAVHGAGDGRGREQRLPARAVGRLRLPLAGARRERLRGERRGLRDEAAARAARCGCTGPTRGSRSRSTMASSPTRATPPCSPRAWSDCGSWSTATSSAPTPGASCSRGASSARASTWRRTSAASSIPSARARSAASSTATGGCWAVDGLVVADASVMPTIPRVNTNLSTLAIAERIAERI